MITLIYKSPNYSQLLSTTLIVAEVRDSACSGHPLTLKLRNGFEFQAVRFIAERRNEAMTTNQLAYQSLQEQRRHNAAMETEERFKNANKFEVDKGHLELDREKHDYSILDRALGSVRAGSLLSGSGATSAKLAIAHTMPPSKRRSMLKEQALALTRDDLKSPKSNRIRDAENKPIKGGSNNGK